MASALVWTWVFEEFTRIYGGTIEITSKATAHPVLGSCYRIRVEHWEGEGPKLIDMTQVRCHQQTHEELTEHGPIAAWGDASPPVVAFLRDFTCSIALDKAGQNLKVPGC